MFQVQQPIMENKHTLPPLSHIITAAAIPFGQQQQQSQQHMPHQQQQAQHQQMMYQVPTNDLEAQRQHSLITPPSSTNSPVDKKDPPSPKYAATQPTDRCTCKHDGNHIPRPRNAFILFRQQHHQSVLDEGNVIKTNPDVSRELGKRWRDLSLQEKEYWNKLAEEEKKRHAEKYPGYRYIPRRFGNKKGSCPYCRAKASIKAQTNALQAQKTVLYDTPDQKSKLRAYAPSMSEEHAIAQSFLSLRNQPQPQSYMQQHPPQQFYYQQYPSMYPPPHQQGQQMPPQHMQHSHMHQQQHSHNPPQGYMHGGPVPLYTPQVAPLEMKSDDLPRVHMPAPIEVGGGSPSEKSKTSCSIASFLN